MGFPSVVVLVLLVCVAVDTATGLPRLPAARRLPLGSRSTFGRAEGAAATAMVEVEVQERSIELTKNGEYDLGSQTQKYAPVQANGDKLKEPECSELFNRRRFNLPTRLAFSVVPLLDGSSLDNHRSVVVVVTSTRAQHLFDMLRRVPETRPVFDPRVSERPLILAIQHSELHRYQAVLSQLPPDAKHNVFLVACQPAFGNGASEMSHFGFGLNRFCALKFLKHRNIDYAWMMDDNVIAIEERVFSPQLNRVEKFKLNSGGMAQLERWMRTDTRGETKLISGSLVSKRKKELKDKLKQPKNLGNKTNRAVVAIDNLKKRIATLNELKMCKTTNMKECMRVPSCVWCEVPNGEIVAETHVGCFMASDNNNSPCQGGSSVAVPVEFQEPEKLEIDKKIKEIQDDMKMWEKTLEQQQNAQPTSMEPKDKQELESLQWPNFDWQAEVYHVKTNIAGLGFQPYPEPPKGATRQVQPVLRTVGEGTLFLVQQAVLWDVQELGEMNFPPLFVQSKEDMAFCEALKNQGKALYQYDAMVVVKDTATNDPPEVSPQRDYGPFAAELTQPVQFLMEVPKQESPPAQDQLLPASQKAGRNSRKKKKKEPKQKPKLSEPTELGRFLGDQIGKVTLVQHGPLMHANSESIVVTAMKAVEIVMDKCVSSPLLWREANLLQYFDDSHCQVTEPNLRSSRNN